MGKFNKILLTGINGQVGRALYPKLQSLGEVIAPDRSQLDLSKPKQIREVVQHIKPDLIINPAAYTAVDKAEEEIEIAYAVNALAPATFAEEAHKLDILLVHYSTDYVFDGMGTRPYHETDTPNPLNVYGSTKLAGENAIRTVDGHYLIFRTSWVYSTGRKNFMHTVLRLASEQEQLHIVSDQQGSPTSCLTIAEATLSAIQQWTSDKSGIYNLTNAGSTTWHGFAKAIVHEYNQLRIEKNWPPLKVQSESIQAIMAGEYPTLAQRPKNSCLDNQKLHTNFEIFPEAWPLALAKVISMLPDHHKSLSVS
ncbi:dTDP-4-dehydrorhamnose reductase [Methylobacillus methanolivorans]|uniref:dTDP-4-dehydrorhamnose reductase n=1 Tax=Methylobacillus methanolivorans TaxID=1848927 RepID=A0ABW8GH41_9PROT